MALHEESIPDLIRGTIRDGIGIVRDEILLARTEMREEVVRIKSGLITIAAAIGVGVLGRDHAPRHDCVGRGLRVRLARMGGLCRCRASASGDRGSAGHDESLDAVARALHAEER